MPWPLPGAAFREVRAIDVLEHLADFVRAVEECHRVLAPGGRLVVQMPFAGGVNHLTDPTHRRGATSRTFDYFIEGTELQRRYGYSAALFRLERRRLLVLTSADLCPATPGEECFTGRSRTETQSDGARGWLMPWFALDLGLIELFAVAEWVLPSARPSVGMGLMIEL